MGRTVPTYRMTLESVARRFGEFRHALRERDRVAFDRLIDRARQHSSAASYEASLEPTEVLFLSVILDQELEIARLFRAVDEISWSVLGHPAGSTGTLDSFVPGGPSGNPPGTKGLPAEGSSAESKTRIMGDLVDQGGRGWRGFLMAKPARNAPPGSRQTPAPVAEPTDSPPPPDAP
jgi:hypothetical protein